MVGEMRLTTFYILNFSFTSVDGQQGCDIRKPQAGTLF